MTGPSRSYSEREAIARAQAAAQSDAVIGEWLGAHEVTGRQRIHRLCGCYVDDTLLATHLSVCPALLAQRMEVKA